MSNASPRILAEKQAGHLQNKQVQLEKENMYLSTEIAHTKHLLGLKTNELESITEELEPYMKI
jgi:hypothetical protein